MSLFVDRLFSMIASTQVIYVISICLVLQTHLIIVIIMA